MLPSVLKLSCIFSFFFIKGGKKDSWFIYYWKDYLVISVLGVYEKFSS